MMMRMLLVSEERQGHVGKAATSLFVLVNASGREVPPVVKHGR
jgi:hypothetical protein